MTQGSECRGVLKKFRFANNSETQLNQSATDQLGALVTRWLAWILLLDIDVRHIPGTKYSAADGPSRRPYSSAEKDEGKMLTTPLMLS
jgi:hypothetical protein